MRIEPATMDDVDAVVAAYAHARTIQIARGSSAWLGFTATAIRDLVDAGQLFCLREPDGLAAVFVALDEDAAIWGDDGGRGYLYLHRLARTATCRTPGVFGVVLEWARSRCHALGRLGIRMDTWADNSTLVAYYQRFGFRVVGTRTMPADPRLLPHYHGIELALLEQRVTARNSR